MRAVIKCSNVWKIYNKGRPNQVDALRGISLSVMKGDFLSITGPSGCGKSTLLNLIGCLDWPTKGAVYLSGKNTAVLNKDELANVRRNKVGFVFQSFNLIGSYTVQENIELPTLFGGAGRVRNVSKKTGSLLKKMGLENRAEHFPSELSIGQTQKVAIVRALMNDPEVILADEPTGNLDSESSLDIMRIFEKLNKEGKTIVTVTHDTNIAMLADRIIHMKDGKVLRF